MTEQVLTYGHGLYVRLRRGVYHEVDRRGRRAGAVCSGFSPRPRWRPARLCDFLIVEDGLTCPTCGQYDTGYAETGIRSYCWCQRGRPERRRILPEDSSGGEAS